VLLSPALANLQKTSRLSSYEPARRSTSPELSFAIENRIATAWNKELRLTRTNRTQKGEKGLVVVVEHLRLEARPGNLGVWNRNRRKERGALYQEKMWRSSSREGKPLSRTSSEGEGPDLAAVCAHGLVGFPFRHHWVPKLGHPRTPSKGDEKDTTE
jgi:hypothetical protein